MISEGTPKKAAGIRNNVPKPMIFDMLCLNAHARLYSSLL